MERWWDPTDGRWHLGVRFWRQRFALSLLWIALFTVALAVTGAWGYNFVTFGEIIWITASAVCVAGWARASRRGWREGGGAASSAS